MFRTHSSHMAVFNQSAGLSDGVSSEGVLRFSQEGQSEEDARRCPTCGGRLGLKLAKSGGFIGCSNYPDCSHTRPLDVQAPGKEGEEATGEAQHSVLSRSCDDLGVLPGVLQL